MAEKVNLGNASLRTFYSWKRCLMGILKFNLIYWGLFFIYVLLKDKFVTLFSPNATAGFVVCWIIFWAVVAIAVVAFVIANIVSWIISPFIHKDIYFLEEGIWIGKNDSNGKFLAWEQIKAFDCGNKSSAEYYGYLIVYTNLPKSSKGRRQRRIKHLIIDVKEPADICNKGMILLMKNK